jgi:hypothetical protein
MINDHKETSSKCINEVRKSTQDLDKKLRNLHERFRKEIEVVGKCAGNEKLNKSNKTQ